MDEFMDAMKEVFPNLLVQFEDFSTDNAFKYLSRFRQKYRCFNDDVSVRSMLISLRFLRNPTILDPGHGCGCTLRLPECCTARIRGFWQATR